MSQANQNDAASVLARLKNEADKTGEPFNPVLSRYVGFRFLYRLSKSSHRAQFLVKGATMFLFWTGSIHRPTRDLDLLSLTEADLSDLAKMFEEICQVECPLDGVVFDPSSVKASLIREDQAYGGSRLTIVAKLGTARVPLQIDVGLGDAVTPDPITVSIPALISNVPEAKVRGYPVESAIAEKIHAMVVLGMTNSRMKDFYDVAYLADSLHLDVSSLSRAVHATFRRRKTEIPTELPVFLSPEFLTDPQIEARWTAFVRKNAIGEPHSRLRYVQDRIGALVTAVLGRGS